MEKTVDKIITILITTICIAIAFMIFNFIDIISYAKNIETDTTIISKKEPTITEIDFINEELPSICRVDQLLPCGIQQKIKPIEVTILEKEQEEHQENNQESEMEGVNTDENGIIAYASDNVEPYVGYITRYTNLKNRTDISVDEMNKIIDIWLNGRDSELKNQGQAFITASIETELDPIFLLALAAQESGWTVSGLHSSKNNPYSINMVDANPSDGYHMGNTFSDGIINGAIWINNHYYNEGQQNLNDMIYGSKCYSSSKDSWIDNIASIMTKSYKYLN